MIHGRPCPLGPEAVPMSDWRGSAAGRELSSTSQRADFRFHNGSYAKGSARIMRIPRPRARAISPCKAASAGARTARETLMCRTVQEVAYAL